MPSLTLVRPSTNEAPAVSAPALVPILLLLRELLTSPEPVVIRPAEFVGLLGAADFTQNTIFLDVSQSWADWTETFVHELLHLHRGPFDPADEDAEEELLEAATRRVMRMLAELRAAIAGGAR
ncbi:hypothetical protein Psed_0853 [Pseudonocardia dioxanivorans CB1190]|uniref:IrrE N-terminal-like domain-containing protein n=1 Tax=Pseudonocardia dioxanivorans (strain ATCC 55486 / DSM 44775 / JCM 13855 / CB1190) TaxID=675635 RepID=F4CSD3_PSEUX|nr:hypothetical protein [Pseudonocardia dioxanivorans]AEA23107.1 hypothetical protein Psed_0853 [Pseudonocardia dioxanivorans CB1190]